HGSSFLQLDLVYQQEFNGSTNDLIGDWLPTINRAINQNLIINDSLRRPDAISYNYNLVDPNQDCIDVSNGTLKLWAREIPPTEFRCIDWMGDNDLLADGFPNKRTFKATSGEIWSTEMFKHGYFESRIKIPYVDYVWPAFWMFHSANGRKTEIDIFEFVIPGSSRGDNCTQVNPQDMFYFSDEMLMTIHDWNLHIPPYSNDPSSYKQVCRGFTGNAINNFHFFNEWHTYGFYWDEYKCIWFVDQIPIAYLFKFYKTYYDENLGLDFSQGIWDHDEYEQYSGPIYRNMGYPIEECHIVLGMAVPNFGGLYHQDQSLNEVCLPTTNSLPRVMEVDYLRVYSNKTCSSGFRICNETHLPTKIAANSVELPDASQGTCSVVVRNEHQIKLQHPYNYHPTEIFSDAQNIEVVANDYVKLNPGFKTEPGVTFVARIDDCATADLRSPLPPQSKPYQQISLNLWPEQIPPQESVDDISGFIIYPNPGNGEFRLKVPSKFNGSSSSLTLYDALGQVVSTNSFVATDEIAFQCNHLPKGIYFASVTIDGIVQCFERLVVL
ncbi:MAG: family 16 glycosylhydrolase, partial [Flavobacteriales bacterium]